MKRLIDLNPAWIDHDGRKGLGVAFDCLVGQHDGRGPCRIRNWVLFANPLDGGPPWPGNSRSLLLALVPNEQERGWIRGCGECRWRRAGETFDTLSNSPSWDAYGCGHMTLTNGVFS